MATDWEVSEVGDTCRPVAGPGRGRSVQIEWISAGTAHLGFPTLWSVPHLLSREIKMNRRHWVCSRDTGGMILILQYRLETVRCTSSSSVKSFWLMMMLCIETSLSVIIRSKSSLQCLYCKLGFWNGQHYASRSSNWKAKASNTNIPCTGQIRFVLCNF